MHWSIFVWMKFTILLLFVLLNPTAYAIVIPDSLSTTCKRNLFIQSDKIIVTILIEKPDSTGFARIYEKLPPGAVASKIKCGKAVYQNEKSMLKFAWEDISDARLIEITYEIKLKEAVDDTVMAITGTFSAEFLPMENDQIAILPGKKEYGKKDPVLLAKKEIPNEEKNTSDPIMANSQQPLSEGSGIYICIQVAAVGKNINSDYLKKQFGYEGEFESHFEENIYRITVGKFRSKAEAEAVLNEYKSKYFKKCFLSAYKDGHKIPVYEAEKLLN